jgi:hypothetical protein
MIDLSVWISDAVQKNVRPYSRVNFRLCGDTQAGRRIMTIRNNLEFDRMGRGSSTLRYLDINDGRRVPTICLAEFSKSAELLTIY